MGISSPVAPGDVLTAGDMASAFRAGWTNAWLCAPQGTLVKIEIDPRGVVGVYHDHANAVTDVIDLRQAGRFSAYADPNRRIQVERKVYADLLAYWIRAVQRRLDNGWTWWPQGTTTGMGGYKHIKEDEWPQVKELVKDLVAKAHTAVQHRK